MAFHRTPPSLLRVAAALFWLGEATCLVPAAPGQGAPRVVVVGGATSLWQGRTSTRLRYDYREGAAAGDEDEYDSTATEEMVTEAWTPAAAVTMLPAPMAPPPAATPATPAAPPAFDNAPDECPTVLQGHELIWHDLPIKPGLTVRSGVIRDQDAVLEACEAKGDDPFGTRVWPSGLAAAIDLCDVANVLRNGALSGLNVVELGAGCGVPSFTAAALGASVTATDLAPLTCQLLHVSACHQTFEDNGGAFGTMELDVADDDTALPRCDILVACDMLYHGWMAEALARRCIEAYERDNAGLIVTSPPGRIGEGRFLALLDKAGVPHSGFEDAILPTWADKLWPLGSDESVTGILRVLPPRLNLGVDQEQILYHGRAPLYKSARRKRRY